MSSFNNILWNRSKYQSLEHNINANGSFQSICTLIMIGVVGTMLTLTAWSMSIHHPVKPTILMVDSTLLMLHKTSPRFLSFGLDSSLLRQPEKMPINDEGFINLTKHLSPAFVRIGGTAADCLFFKQTAPEVLSNFISDKAPDIHDITNFTITGEFYVNLYKFTQDAGIRMLFDLNALIRTNQNEWNSTNAEEIIKFSKGHNMDVDWQLGNEPNSFRHVFNRTISGAQLGRDYQRLRILLNSMGYSSSILVGPEANHIGDINQHGIMYIEEFLKNQLNSVDFITWHQYYLNGRIAKPMDFIDPKVFNELPIQINGIKNIIKKNGSNIKMWISETSTAYGGGARKISDRFVAGFLWLDKLGYSASAGVDVVIRQSLFGGNYAMIGDDLIPNPDWWVSVIYKQLVSEIVLDLKAPDNFGTLRFYAHCTAKSALVNRVPAITLYGMNLDHKDTDIFLQGLNKNADLLLYILTADYLQSREIKLNGKPLKLGSDGSLPSFSPVIIKPHKMITLPPISMVFIVVHGAEIPICKLQ